MKYASEPEICHKVDGTEYWERVRASHYRASQRKSTKLGLA